MLLYPWFLMSTLTIKKILNPKNNRKNTVPEKKKQYKTK